MRTSPVSLVPRSLTFTALVAALGGTLAGCGGASDDADPPAPGTGEAVAGCAAAGPLVAPATPALAPPAGSDLYLRLRADGTQIYTCGAAAGGGWQWSLKAPQARLIDDRCREAGSHFAGPSWKVASDGSTVVGRKAAEVAAPTTGDIPWLLIEAVSKTGTRMLDPVSYIQRVDTAGGVAPADGCNASTQGTEVAIPYAATYLYYRPLGGSPAVAAGTSQL
jgi:hypothetical protein